MPDGTVIPKNGTETFGFWLPHGLDGTDNVRFAAQVHQCKEGFNKIEEAFREVEGFLERSCGLSLNRPRSSSSIPSFCLVMKMTPSPPKTRSSSIVLTGMDVSGL